MTEPTEKPKMRQYTDEMGRIVTEMPFTRDEGWATVTVGWEEDQYTAKDGSRRGCWYAKCSAHPWVLADSETSQLDALANLVCALSGLCGLYEKREVELHRAIHNSPDSLAKELREAQDDLSAVQQTICTRIDTPDTTPMLEPLWRAQRAIEAFAARIATRPTEDQPE